MVAGAEVGALGEAHPIAETDGGEVIEPGVFCQPAGSAQLQAPGELDAQAGFYVAGRANAGPEAAQQQGRAGLSIGRGAVVIELLDHEGEPPARSASSVAIN